MDNTKSTAICVFLVLLMILTPLSALLSHEESRITLVDEQSIFPAEGRAQTTWSGSVTVTSSHTVSVFDELIISACTNVEMGSGARIYVEGRLTVEGTKACPVTLSSLTGADHEGIQFNSSSNSRGSVLNNLTVTDSIYSITMYGSDPVIHNLTLNNPDRVGIDLFGSSTPYIYDLVINQAGRLLPLQNDWRYGIGLSVGDGSTPVLDGAIFTDHLTRALNIWGGSGGVFRNIVMDNISGSSWVTSAGVWVEDSQPLLTNLTIDKSDNGVAVRHIDNDGYTRAVFRDTTITNSMYRGVYVDKENHSDYSNYETADFTNLTVTGTGGPDSKTPGIAFAAIDVNATGAWFENTLVENASSVGVRLYYTDSSTTFRNLTIRDTGDLNNGPHEAGLAVTWTFASPTFEDLEISGSVGSGVHTYKSTLGGSEWYLHNNSKDGMYLDYSSVAVNELLLENNSESGAHLLDNLDTLLENLTSQFNGFSGTDDNQKAGVFFDRSKTVTHPQLDVGCKNCTVTNSAGSGVYIRDSADLWLSDLHLAENHPGHAPFDADNSGLTLGQQGGVIHVHNLTIHTERTGTSNNPAMLLQNVAANLDSIALNGNHSGIQWDGQNNNNYPSILSNSILSGTGCLTVSNHQALSGSGNTIAASCTGTLQLINSQVNWSGLTDMDATLMQLDSTSNLHLHQPVDIDLASSVSTIASGASVDVAFDLTVWVINNQSNGVPRANVGATFSQFQTAVQDSTDDLGYLFLPDFVGQRWTNTGASGITTVAVSCGYDSISNSTNVSLDQDRFVNCVLPLDNQPPFLMWATPVDLGVFISQGPVEFNASDTWDLDDDELSFTWTSDLDGDIVASCTGQGEGNGLGISQEDMTNGVPFTVNTNYLNTGCQLSDGIHVITLEVCDDAGHCVSESRTIELVNQPPTIVFDVTPAMTPWSELVIPRTQNVLFNLTGTFDPEGDTLSCWIKRSYQQGQGQPWLSAECPTEIWMNLSMAETVPSTFDLEIYASDGINHPASVYIIPVELYNEVPEPVFTLTRLGNASEDEVTLDGTATIDPEGDTLEIEYWSSLDGQLSWNDTEAGKVWTGHLSRGVHSIEMRVVDNRPEHINATRVTSMLVDVENSLPQAVIETPTATQAYTSSDLIGFSANGSGDYDAACSTYPVNGSWHCAESTPQAGSEYLVVSWTSDLDGRLTPEGEDWLLFEARLSAGSHTVTLSLDDGIHDPVLVSQTVEVTVSAPQLALASPLDGSAFNSETLIQWDARDSVDYDGDSFSMTVRSDLLNEPLLSNVDPSIVHQAALPAGEHSIRITLSDDTGMEQTTVIGLVVGQSDPNAVMLKPVNLVSIGAGEALILEESSSDADGDMQKREWRLWLATGGFEVISTQSSDSVQIPPGQHQLSLYVEDGRGQSDESFVNITVQSSLPSLSNLTFSPNALIAEEKNVFTVRVMMSDPDGTTQLVQGTIVFNVQSWTFNLSDEDNDGYWEGSVELVPETSGRPNLKIIATDGTVADPKVDVLSVTLLVEEREGDNRFAVLAIAIGGFIGLLVLLSVVALRRQRRAEIEAIDSWDSFGAIKPQSPDPNQPAITLEGGIVESATQIEAEEQVNESSGDEDDSNTQVAGIDLDWDNV